MWTELDKSVRIYRSRQVCENVWRPGGHRLSRSGYLLFVQTISTTTTTSTTAPTNTRGLRLSSAGNLLFLKAISTTSTSSTTATTNTRGLRFSRSGYLLFLQTVNTTSTTSTTILLPALLLLLQLWEPKCDRRPGGQAVDL